MNCDHKFVDSKVCLKCGISFAELKAECLRESQRLSAPSPEPAAKTELTAEELYHMRRSCSADVLRLLDEHAARGRRIAELERLVEALQSSGELAVTRAEAAEAQVRELTTTIERTGVLLEQAADGEHEWSPKFRGECKAELARRAEAKP